MTGSKPVGVYRALSLASKQAVRVRYWLPPRSSAAPLGLRSIELLEHLHRVQPPRIVDVGDPGSPVVGVSGEVGEVGLEAVGVVFPTGPYRCDDHERGAQVDQQREARVAAPLLWRPGHAAAAARWWPLPAAARAGTGY